MAEANTASTAFWLMIQNKDKEFDLTNRNYNLTEVARHYGKKYPILIYVSSGWCGKSEADSWGTHEMYRVERCVTQTRLIAQDSNSSQLYSIPIDYPVKLELMDKKGKFQKPASLSKIIDNHKLPLQGKFDTKQPKSFYLGKSPKQTTPLQKSNITIIESIQQSFFICNPIYKCIMNPENIALIPLNAEIEVQVATGFIGHPRTDFYSYMGVLTDTLCQINFDNIKGQKDIMMVRDKTSAQAKLDNIALPTRSENIYETLEYVKLEGFSNPYEFTNLIPSSESGYVTKMAAPSIYEGRDSYLHIGTPISTDNENDVTPMKALAKDEKPNVPDAADEGNVDQAEEPHKGDNQSASDVNIYDNSLKAESAPAMAELTRKMSGMRSDQDVAMVTELTQLIKKHDDSVGNLPDNTVKDESPTIPFSGQQSPIMPTQSPLDQITLTPNPQNHNRDPTSPIIDQTNMTPHGSDTARSSQTITQSNPMNDQQSPMTSPQGSIIDQQSPNVNPRSPIMTQQSLDSSSRTPPKPAPKPRVSKQQRASWPLQQAPVIVEDEKSNVTPVEASQTMPKTEDVTENIRPALKPKPNFKNKKPSDRSPVYENVQIIRSTKPVTGTDAKHDTDQKMVVENENTTAHPSDDDYLELVKSTNQAAGPHPGIHSDDQLHLDDVPRDLSSLSVQQVGQCLQQLNLENYIQVFAENLIDGDFLMSLDQSLLETEFKMGRLEVRRLMKFIKEGWRPKSDDGKKT